MESAFVLLPIGVILIGAASIWSGRRSHLRLRAARAWPTTPGKILSSKAYSERKRDKDGSYSTEYRRSVEYEYVVGDKTLKGRRIDFAAETIYHVQSSCEKAVAAYPAGATVPIHYDPTNPEDAVLDVTRGDSVTMYGIGGFFILVGLVFLYFFLTAGFGGGNPSHILEELKKP